MVGALNAYWVHHSGLTAAHWTLNAVCIGAGLVLLAFLQGYSKRNPQILPDEYAEARRKYAAQMGLVLGWIAAFAKYR